MLLESKEGTLTYGILTVSGTGDLRIPCRGRPLEVQVSFTDSPPPPPCGPVVPDEVEISIDHLVHPFPLWAIKIGWEIHSGGIREISWRATVVR